MTVSFNTALSQYNAAAKRVLDTSNKIAQEATPPVAAGGTFMDMVQDVVQDAVVSGKQSEKISMDAINGEADVREVAVAVANAEIALQTVVTVRDKVMSAYQQIMKMQI